jgi:hypothetical protein
MLILFSILKHKILEYSRIIKLSTLFNNLLKMEEISVRKRKMPSDKLAGIESPKKKKKLIKRFERLSIHEEEDTPEKAKKSFEPFKSTKVEFSF